MPATASIASSIMGQKWPYIGGIGSRSISGNGYSVSTFKDGSVALVVNDVVFDFSDKEITDNAFDTFAHAGAMLARYTPAERMQIIADKYEGKDCTLSGVRWAADGTYLGLNWDE